MPHNSLVRDLGEVLAVIFFLVHYAVWMEFCHDDPTIFQLAYLDTLVLLLAVVFHVVIVLPWKLAKYIFDGVYSPQRSFHLRARVARPESIHTAQAPHSRTNSTDPLILPDMPSTASLTDLVALSLMFNILYPVQVTEQPATGMAPSNPSVRRCVTQIACDEPYIENVTDFPSRLEDHNHDFNTCNDCFQQYLEFEISNTHWSRILSRARLWHSAEIPRRPAPCHSSSVREI